MPLGKVQLPSTYPIAFKNALERVLGQPSLYEQWVTVLQMSVGDGDPAHMAIRARSWHRSLRQHTAWWPQASALLETHKLKFRLRQGELQMKVTEDDDEDLLDRLRANLTHRG